MWALISIKISKQRNYEENIGQLFCYKRKAQTLILSHAHINLVVITELIGGEKIIQEIKLFTREACLNVGGIFE